MGATRLNSDIGACAGTCLPRPRNQMFFAVLRFGKHGCALPDDSLSPIAAPSWLDEALAVDSPTAEQLLGKYILYKWPPRLRGWAVGKVTAALNDASLQVKGKRCNFAVFYECDQQSADHTLSLCAYARSAKSPSDSWVLLG